MTRSAAASKVPRDRVVTAPADRRTAILDVIRGSETRLSLSLFRCNDDQVFDEIERAVSRGVAVEILTTARAKNRKQIEKLRKNLTRTGAEVHTYADPVVKYHAKYLVADDGPAVVASLNFTKKCFKRTCDALVVTHDPDVVAGLHKLMATDRDGKNLPDALTPRLIIGPERARRQITALIEGARESIRLIDAKLSDPDLATLLNSRRAAGVTVEVAMAKRVGDLKSHGKIMLIDNKVAVVGSLALAALSLEFRREVAIVVDDREAVAEVEQLFRAIPAVEIAGQPSAGLKGEALC